MSIRIKKTSIVYLLFTLFFIGTLSACSNKDITSDNGDLTSAKKVSFTNISPAEAKKRLESEEGIIVLDVRTKEEYDTGHIKGSILIPVDNLEKESENKLQDKSAPIFVYCRSGSRSVAAANILVKQGYENVFNLGGISNWPYETVK